MMVAKKKKQFLRLRLICATRETTTIQNSNIKEPI